MNYERSLSIFGSCERGQVAVCCVSPRCFCIPYRKCGEHFHWTIFCSWSSSVQRTDEDDQCIGISTILRYVRMRHVSLSKRLCMGREVKQSMLIPGVIDSIFWGGIRYSSPLHFFRINIDFYRGMFNWNSASVPGKVRTNELLSHIKIFR